MTFILPFWLSFGLYALGVGGWGSLALIYFIAPLLLLILGIIGLLVGTRRDVRKNKQLNPTDALVLTSLYTSIFLFGFFTVNGADTEESINSVAMELFGRGFQSASDWLGQAFFIISIILIVIAFVLFLYEILVKPVD